MSTKCTIRYGKRWHLYQECFEDDVVYLELEGIGVQLCTHDMNNHNIILRLDNDLALETGIISKKEKPHKIDWDNVNKNIDKLFGKKNETK